MKRAIAYVLLTLSALVFLVSAMDDVTKLLSDWRKSPASADKWWAADQYRYGDLYGFTYLPEFRNANLSDPDTIKPPNCTAGNKLSINIYALSDSYTWNVFRNAQNFCSVKNSGFAASNFRDVLPVSLDTSMTNLVVIETTERNVRTLLTDSAYLSNFLHLTKPSDDTTTLATSANRKKFQFSFRIKDNEANYEFNLWNYALFRPLKELKAELNYKWFNRVNPDAAISPDGKHLFLGTTVDSSYLESSFRPIAKSEVDKIVSALNSASAHYKKLGFTCVYLAIIPNPVTILSPHYKGLSYNNLIPAIQSRKDLKLTVFDVYSIFNKSSQKAELYSRSDTHWTSIGRQLFMDSLNAKLQRDNFR